MTEQTEWLAYIFAGLLVPALALFFSRTKTIRPYVLPTLFVATSLLVVWLQPESLMGSWDLALIFALSAVHFFLDLRFHPRLASDLFSKASHFIQIFCLWFLGSRMLWFTGLCDWIFQGGSGVVALLLAFALGYGALFAKGANLKKQQEYVLLAVSFLLFGFFATRATLNFKDACVFSGPVELMSQGGWLLWDVPSQYGFLNILLISLVPSESAWLAVYLVNSFFLFISSGILFYFCYRRSQGFLGWLFATMLVIVTVYMAPGWLPELVGVNSLPSIGGFRFFWCYVLLLIFVSSERWGRRHLVWGALAWSLGAIWSFESLIFSSLIWLPAAVSGAGAGFKNKIKVLALSLGLFLFLLLGISLYYLTRLGHLPDLRGFYEFAFVYKGGIGALPVNLAGSVWLLVLVYGILASALVSVKSSSQYTRSLILASGAMVWSTTSYYIWRSHENQITNLAPLYLGAILCGGMLKELPQITSLSKRFVLVVFTILSVGVFSHQDHVEKYFETLFAPRSAEAIFTQFPQIDPKLVDLISQATLKADDPIAYFTMGPVFPNSHRHWLPYSPDFLTSLLPLPRQMTLIERFLERHHFESGGLVQSTAAARSSDPYIKGLGVLQINPQLVIRKLSETHHVTRQLANDQWQFFWFEKK